MIYRFGAYELDVEAGELRKGGSPVALQPKPFQLLQLLIEARDRIVPLDELFEAIWPDTAVTPSSLTRAVSHARRAIGDTHKGDAIKSHARRGYRFCADVLEVGGEAQDAAAAPPSGVAGPRRELPPFVGREPALEALRRAFDASAAGQGQVVVVEGRPGVGKTRLCEEFAGELRARGGLVLRAQGREGEGVPAFWLWTQILRQMAAEEALAEAGSELADRSAELGLLVPELDASGGPTSDSTLSKEQARFLFFDAVTRALSTLARARPTLLVLEDVHWAGSSSLRLLEHLAHELGAAPLCVVVTVREEPRPDGASPARLLGSLRRLDRCVPLKLGGFTRGEVAELLHRVLGRPPAVELTSELYARTEGVPLYLREALRWLDERGALEGCEPVRAGSVVLPAESLGLIARGFDVLSESAASLMGAASVLGREFGLAALAETANLERDRTLDLLDESIAAGIVEEDPDSTAAFRFTHALFQDAAYERVPAGRRSRLHLRAADRLERRHAEDPDSVIQELASHYHRALAVADPERSWECAMRAGECATRLLAWEQAALHYEGATEALEHMDEAGVERRLETWLRLGEARLASGDRSGRQQILQRAMDLARQHDRNEVFARAAILFCDTSEWAVPDAAGEAAVDEALERIGSGPSAERARLLTRHSYRYIRLDPEAGKPLAREAVELARRSGSGVALQEALYVLLFLLAGPDHLDERAELAAEMVEVASTSPLEAETVIASIDVASDSLEREDPNASAHWRDEAVRLSGGAPPPVMGWHISVFDAGVALMRGEFDRMLSQTESALSLGLRAHHPFARGCDNVQRAVVSWERGEFEDVLARFLPFIGVPTAPLHWVLATSARAAIRLGDETQAWGHYRQAVDEGLGAIPRDIRWTRSMVEVAHACADLGDEPQAEAILAELRPVRDHHAILPTPICYAGPVRWAEARLLRLQGHLGEACHLLSDALRDARVLGARPAEARILAELAQVQNALGRTAEGTRAHEEATMLADEMGLALGA